MAFVEADDLLDAIHHEFGVLDDTGLCAKVLPKPSKRSKPGGLPLNFRSEKEESDEEQYSPGFTGVFDEVSTKEVVQERLRSRTGDSERSAGVDARCEYVLVAGQFSTFVPNPDSDLFRFRAVGPVQANQSATSRLVREKTRVVDANLAAYAKFEATGSSKSRELLVFYPFADALPEERYGCALRVSVNPQTCITDLIGLCCLVYSRQNRTPEIRNPSRFQMLMAEENGEVDHDLPAIDGHRSIAELGSCWSTVALVERSSFGSSEFETNTVVVYTVVGGRYEFALDSLDVTLRWLRDRTLERRIALEGRSFLSDYPILQEYTMEAVDEKDVPLNLDVTVGSTSLTEFVLVRKNSSRGDFMPPNRTLAVETDLTSPQSPAAGSPPNGKASPRDFLRGNSVEQGGLNSPSSPTASEVADLGLIVAEYSVDWIHRYKPRLSARFLLHKEGVELVPLTEEKKRSILFSNPNAKALSILWDHVGGVEIAERPNARRVLRITYIRIPDFLQNRFRDNIIYSRNDVSSSLSNTLTSCRSEGTSLRQLAQMYESTTWKVLSVEASVDDAWSIAQRLNDVIDVRRSQVRTLYQHSSGGTKRPAAALECLSPAPTDTLSKRPSVTSVSIGGHRFSRFTSAVANAMPKLQRTRSRQDE